MLAAALLLGGLRESRLAAAAEAFVFAAIWLERPALGPFAAWLPWLVWATLSASLSAQPFAAASFLARWSAVLALFSLTGSWERQERESWLKTMLTVTAIFSAAALWTGYPDFRAAMTGLLPPYYNYTTFALSAGASAAAVWAFHSRTKPGVLRSAALAVSSLGVVCLLLAHGRGAQVGVLVAAIVWSGRRWGARAGLAGLAALAVAVGVVGAMSPTWRADISHHGSRYEGARPDIWRGAARIASDHPLLGVGPGSFGAAFRLHPAEARGLTAARWGMDTDYAHSEPLQVAAETGWMGLILWLGALGASFSFLWGRASEEPAREAAAIAAVAMGVHLLVDNILQLPGLAMLFFSALAVAGAPTVSERRWPRAAAVAGMILALVSWIPRALADGDPARAAAIYPLDSHPREDLAYRAMAAGKITEADALWAQAEERGPYNAVYPWRRAQIAAAQGRWDAAEKAAARAAELEPFFLNDRVLRAEALAHLNRGGEAREELAGVLRTLQDRGERPAVRGYESTVWDFDRKEYDRVAALAGRAKR